MRQELNGRMVQVWTPGIPAIKLLIYDGGIVGAVNLMGWLNGFSLIVGIIA
jgi:hypothetical protein